MKRASRLKFLVILLLTGCLRVPLEVKPQGDHVEVDVASFGEYPTSVSRIRLSEEASRRVVWELAAGAKPLGFWNFTLHLGDNPVTCDGAIGGQYQVVTPRVGGSFFLRTGATYVLEVWNKSGLRCSTAKFKLVGSKREGG
jgi:hypothetical protein